MSHVVVQGGGLAGLSLLVSQALAFANFVVLARLAPPATFGAYAAASILVGVGGLFVDSGINAAIVHRQDRLREAASTGFAANIVGAAGLAVLAAALGPVVGLFFDSREIGIAAAVMAGTLPLTAAAIVPGALLQRQFSYRRLLFEPLTVVAYTISSISLLAAGTGIWGLIIATYIATATRTIGYFLLSRWRPRLRLVSFEMWRSLARYGRHVLLSELYRQLGFVATTAIVGRALGVTPLGNFRLASQLVNQASAPAIYGSAYVLFPALARISHDEKRFQLSLLRSLRLLTLIVFPISFLFIPIGEPLAVVVFGETWRDAGPIMMALSGLGAAVALQSIASEVFKAHGRPQILPTLNGLAVLTSVAFMAALLPLGAVGIGLGLSFGALVTAVYALWKLAQVTSLPLSSILLQLRPALVGTVVMTFGVLILERFVVHADRAGGIASAAALVLEILVAGGLYLLTIRIVAPTSLRELKDAGKLVVARRRRGSATPEPNAVSEMNK